MSKVPLLDLLPTPRQVALSGYQIISAVLCGPPIAGITITEKVSIDVLFACSPRFGETDFNRKAFFAAIREEVSATACVALIRACVQRSTYRQPPPSPSPSALPSLKRPDALPSASIDLEPQAKRSKPSPDLSQALFPASSANEFCSYMIMTYMENFLTLTTNIVQLQRQFASLNHAFTQRLHSLDFTVRLTAQQRAIYFRLLAHPLDAPPRQAGFTDIVALSRGSGKSMLQALVAAQIAARGGIVLFVSANTPGKNMDDYYLCRIREKFAELAQMGFLQTAPLVEDVRLSSKRNVAQRAAAGPPSQLYWTNCWVAPSSIAAALGCNATGTQRQPTAIFFDDLHDCSKMPKRIETYRNTLSPSPVSVCFASADSGLRVAPVDPQLQRPDLNIASLPTPTQQKRLAVLYRFLTLQPGRRIVIVPPEPAQGQPPPLPPPIRDIPTASSLLEQAQKSKPNFPMGAGGEEALAKFAQHFSHSNNCLFFLELENKAVNHVLLPGLNLYADSILRLSTKDVSTNLVYRYLKRFYHYGSAVSELKILLAVADNALLSSLVSKAETPLAFQFKLIT